MSDRFAKITSILSYVLFGLSILVGILFYYTTATMDPIPEHITIPLEKTKYVMEQMGSILDNFVYVVYLLVGLAAISTVLFSIVSIFSSGRTAKRSLISMGILGALIFVAFSLASPEIPVFLGVEKFDITGGISRAVGTGLFSMYLFFVIAVVSIFYTEISKAFK